jgi:5-methylcytosine-specific restriction protein A
LVPKGYCEKHKRQNNRQRAKGNFRERGYTTSWDKVKAMKKRRDPLCEPCLKEGWLVPVHIVHHIKPVEEGGAMLDMDNLMSVCRTCHGKLHSKN